MSCKSSEETILYSSPIIVQQKGNDTNSSGSKLSWRWGGMWGRKEETGLERGMNAERCFGWWLLTTPLLPFSAMVPA